MIPDLLVLPGTGKQAVLSVLGTLIQMLRVGLEDSELDPIGWRFAVVDRPYGGTDPARWGTDPRDGDWHPYEPGEIIVVDANDNEPLRRRRICKTEIGFRRFGLHLDDARQYSNDVKRRDAADQRTFASRPKSPMADAGPHSEESQ